MDDGRTVRPPGVQHGESDRGQGVPRRSEPAVTSKEDAVAGPPGGFCAEAREQIIQKMHSQPGGRGYGPSE